MTTRGHLPRLGTKKFASAPDQASRARAWVSEALGPGHPAYDDCELLVSEVFTNAVRYGQGDTIEVSAYADGHAVRVEVVDAGGETVPHLVDDPDGETGRGLLILRALTDTWGCRRLPDGRLRVWFVLDPNAP
ncbi:ATP-binding protein [Actinomadura harenae]|uniref:ATP-binding protein n=1 Tax=Actinomadura harenae TaxID=2483351 RepID=UPI0013158147|nr:ATP-binding protein [Actinomadura harenae]